MNNEYVVLKEVPSGQFSEHDTQKNERNNRPSENTNIRNTMNNIIINTSYFLIYSLITSLIQ
jgi:hypothetical protein